MLAGKFVPRPVEENDRDIELIRDPWFEEVFDQTQKSIDAGEPLRGACSALRSDQRADQAIGIIGRRAD